METNQFLVLMLSIAAGGAFVIADAVRALVRTVRKRRDQRQLNEAGLTTTAQVVAVDPMARELNDAAGHAVQLGFQDGQGNQRRVRDTTGLGGYLVREGAQVVVRYVPANPALVRVEAIVGRYGPYPVDPDGRRRAGSLTPRLTELGAGAGALVGSLFLGLAGPQVAGGLLPEAVRRSLLPWLFVLIGVVLVGVSWRQLARQRRGRRRPRDEVVGVVTEVWQKLVSSGRRTSKVHPFTVHFATGDGREVHTRSSLVAGFRPQLYQRVRVCHEREHPIRFELREQRDGAWVAMALPLFVGVAFLTVGLALGLLS